MFLVLLDICRLALAVGVGRHRPPLPLSQLLPRPPLPLLLPALLVIIADVTHQPASLPVEERQPKVLQEAVRTRRLRQQPHIRLLPQHHQRLSLLPVLAPSHPLLDPVAPFQRINHHPEPPSRLDQHPRHLPIPIPTPTLSALALALPLALLLAHHTPKPVTPELPSLQPSPHLLQIIPRHVHRHPAPPNHPHPIRLLTRHARRRPPRVQPRQHPPTRHDRHALHHRQQHLIPQRTQRVPHHHHHPHAHTPLSEPEHLHRVLHRTRHRATQAHAHRHPRQPKRTHLTQHHKVPVIRTPRPLLRQLLQLLRLQNVPHVPAQVRPPVRRRVPHEHVRRRCRR